jgi:hypothetical protein
MVEKVVPVFDVAVVDGRVVGVGRGVVVGVEDGCAGGR